MITAKRIYSFTLLVLSLSLVYCASSPKYKFAADTDIPLEINKLDEQLKMARQEQLNVFAPDSYRSATEALDAAKKGQERKQSRKSIMTSLGDARGYTDLTFKNGERIKKDLDDIAQARALAIQAGALYLSKTELEDLDKDFKDYTDDLEEDNKESLRQKDRVRMQGAYLDLEMKTIKKDKLGTALSFIESAKKADAKKFAPQTLVKAEEKYYSAEKILETARNDEGTYGPVIKEATEAARQLLKITLTAKNAKKMTPEQMALEINAQEQVIEQNLRASRALRERTEAQSATLADIKKENRALTSDVQFEDKLKEIESRFTKGEAEVYRQGDAVVVRLKDLQFPSSRAELPQNSFATLAKVSNVIKELDAEKVTVEGHTDSLGAKAQNQALSQKRAQAVGEYLISERALTSDQIETVGRGFEKPLADNKTKDGRAQNRRVDVIIQPQKM